MRFLLLEIEKYRGRPLAWMLGGFVAVAVLLQIGLITRMDEIYQAWSIQSERRVSPTYLYLYKNQQYFFGLFSVFTIALSGYMQYIETKGRTWSAIVLLPVAPVKVFFAKVLLSFLLLAVSSALVWALYYVSFEIGKTSSVVLRSATLPGSVWASGWLLYVLMLPLSLGVVHLLGLWAQRRVGIYLLAAMIFYLLAALINLAPGLPILHLTTTPVVNYLSHSGAEPGISMIMSVFLYPLLHHFFLSLFIKIQNTSS